MKTLWIAFVLAAVTALWLAARAAAAMPRMVKADGAQTRMLVAGNHGPVVVLETFGEMPLDYWGTIQWRCARFSRVVSYDHRGTGGSDAGPKPRDARAIATELHAALQAAHLPPPYVLVGYSFGGPYIRVFAGLYPKEVRGMVLIDPSQEEFFEWLKLHYSFINRITPDMAAKQDEMGCTWPSLNEARASVIPRVPLILVSAVRPFGPLSVKLLSQWQACHERWVEQIPGAQQIITRQSGHGIIWEEPDLVVSTIHDMVGRVDSAKAVELHK